MEQRFKQVVVLGLMIGLFGFWCSDVLADGAVTRHQPWEKFGINLGGFVSDLNSTVRVGSGLGLDIDVEKALGLDAQSTIFRIDSNWRFSHNRRHRIDLMWFAVNRSAGKTVGQDFDITNPDGTTTTINAGSDVSSQLNLDIIESAYSYSFFQDERADLAAVVGLYVMPINFGLQASGLTVAEGALKFTAPLPVIGYRMDFALTPQWMIRTGSQFFYVEYNGFVGKLANLRGAVEYLPLKHLGVGLGFDSLRASFEGAGKDYANVNINGNVQFDYTGLQLYARYFF